MEKLYSILLKTLNVKPEEGKIFFLLVAHSFFLGLFISVYYTLANSSFIQHFDSKFLSAGYIISGVAGYFTTMGYSRIQKKAEIGHLFLYALAFIFVLSLLLWFSVGIFGARIASFMLFAFAMPFQSVISLEMGGLALQLLDFKQTKRLFGLINTGSIIASIIGYFSIPLVLTMSAFRNPFNLLFIGIISVGASIVLLYSIVKQNREKLGRPRTTSASKFDGTFGQLLRSRLFVLISLSVVLSSVAMYFTDFSFLAGLKSQRSLVSTAEGRANFLAIAYGTMKIGELILATLASRFFSNYGMNIAISTISFVSASLIILATITGFSFGETSLMLFIFILMNKSFDNMLRRPINDTAFKILYQTLPEEQRLGVQTKVGLVIQIAIMLSGVMLFVVNKLFITETGVRFNMFLLVFIPILLAWFFVSRKIYESYKGRLRQILTDTGYQRKRYIVAEDYSLDLLQRQLIEKDVKSLEPATLLLSEFNLLTIAQYAPYLLSLDNEKLNRYAITAISPQAIKQPEQVTATRNLLQQTLAKATTDKQKEQIQQALKYIDFDDKGDHIPSKAEFAQIARQGSSADKFWLLRYIAKNGSKNTDSLIAELMTDDNKLVSQSAIRLAVQHKSPMLIRLLMNMISEKQYSRSVLTELTLIGGNIVEEVDRVFRDEKMPNVKLRIIEFFAHASTPEANNKLLSYINYPDKTIMLAVIKALKFCRYQADFHGKVVIKQRLTDSVSHILWVYAAILDLKDERSTLKLVQSLDTEREMEFDILFDLLGLIYEWAIVDLIKQNVVGEQNIFALELIDNFIEPDIKEIIGPLFEGLSIGQQIRKLQDRFPQERLKFEARLKDIINKDYNKVDLWTKNRALELLGKQEGELPNEVFACLYHPNELLWSTAARIVYAKYGVPGLSYLERSPTINKRFIRSITRNDQELQNIITEKVKLIKRVPNFFGIPEGELVKLAEIFNTRLVGSNARIKLLDDNVDWVIILIKGRLVGTDEQGNEVSFSRKDVIIRGENVPNDVHDLLAKKGSLVLTAERTDFFNMLIDELELTKTLLLDTK